MWQERYLLFIPLNQWTATACCLILTAIWLGALWAVIRHKLELRRIYTRRKNRRFWSEH